MTKLTTQQIIWYIDEDVVPAEWAWESAIESVMSDSMEDAADGARFLEQLHPGRSWSAAEYHGLMHHHFTGRWKSAVEIGYLRANERFEDNPKDIAWFAYVTMTAAHVEQWIRERSGTHVFDCADGTVLTFDHIKDGVITEEGPS